MENLDFTYNWNRKLDCDMYTTIRINQTKFYAGNQFNIRLKKADHHRAEVVEVKTFALDKLNAFMAGIDTGYSVEECKQVIRRMYGEKADSLVYVFVLLKKLK